MSGSEARPQFAVGDIVEHLRFGYRGVVYGADARFALTEDWYEAVAQSRPPKDAPWYHVLVDGSEQTTYVAERHLVGCGETTQIDHPLLGRYFEAFDGRAYRPRSLH